MAPASPWWFIQTPGIDLHPPPHPAHIPQVSKDCLSLKIINCSLSLLSSLAQSCPTLCDPMNRGTPGFPDNHQLLEFTQTHVHRHDGEAIQPSHPLLSPSPPTFNLFSSAQVHELLEGAGCVLLSSVGSLAQDLWL